LNLHEALGAWREAVGVGHVITDTQTLGEIETATFATAAKVSAVVCPASREELQECLRIANRFKVPVYPISRGKNWGYGSRVPAAGRSVLFALERMNRILDFDERLAYLTVEPGVSFAQAHKFLEERRARLMLGCPGSTPDASLVGNALERGIASGLNGERAQQVCGFEVVLPDGSCVNTGLGRFDAREARRVFSHGVGPSLDGLFTQSNLGIVTQMTFWLTPVPPFYQYFSFAINNANSLARLVDTLQTTKREGLVETSIGLFNAYKILSYVRRYIGPEDQSRRLRLENMPADYIEPLHGGAWFGEGALTAHNQEIGEIKRRLLKQSLSGAVDQLSFDDPNSGNPLVGESLNCSLASVYWRKDELPAEMDPDRDGCGLIWCCPVVPFRGQSLAAAVEIIEEVMDRFEFEPIIGAQCMSPRAIHVVASISYDRHESGHDEKALACHRRLADELAHGGFFPYRLGVQSMNSLPRAKDDSGRLLKILKRSIDPSDILAPGRYDFRSDWPEE
jgi:4-cresol dehydrogenase (hydroxylating)